MGFEIAVLLVVNAASRKPPAARHATAYRLHVMC